MSEPYRANRSLPTGTVTFLFTDIEGSTRHWETQHVAMQQAPVHHDAIIRDTIEANAGYLVKTTGASSSANCPLMARHQSLWEDSAILAGKRTRNRHVSALLD